MRPVNRDPSAAKHGRGYSSIVDLSAAIYATEMAPNACIAGRSMATITSNYENYYPFPEIERDPLSQGGSDIRVNVVTIQARNFAIAATTRSGRSRCGRWPTPSIGTTLAPDMRRANSSA